MSNWDIGVVCSKTTKTSKDFRVSNENGTLSNKTEEDSVQDIFLFQIQGKKTNNDYFNGR